MGRAWCERRWLGGLAPALTRPLLPGCKALGFVSPSPVPGRGVLGPGHRCMAWAQCLPVRSGAEASGLGPKPQAQAPGPRPGSGAPWTM